MLQEAGLPIEDLEPSVLWGFLVARRVGEPVGAAGLECHGGVALLRSVVVDEPLRGTGLGKRLVAAAEKRARGLGINDLYLLTTTAPRFFASLGYVPADREDAPEAIRQTAQFSQLCPSSSAFMVKHLGNAHAHV